MSLSNNREMIDNRFDNPNELLTNLISNVEKVIVGKSEAVQLCVIALLCGGHVLLEDVPGVGKTVLVRSLAMSLGCTFGRIQFTPDLLPTDVTGVSIYNQKTNEFEFRPGPVMANIVLADEINRTSPKTQSALLEAMEEGSVTVDGITYDLPRPFFIMATQNPIEYEGTFPLPEAQLDRFLFKISMGYPSEVQEVEILGRQQRRHPLQSLEPITDINSLLELQEAVRDVFVDVSIQEYIVAITSATRSHPAVYLGASPRGSLALFHAAQALAFLAGRSYVVPDDVKQLVPYAIAHRIILKTEARLAGTTVSKVIYDILLDLAVPITRP